MIVGTGKKRFGIHRGGIAAPDVIPVAVQIEQGLLLGDVPVLDEGVIGAGDEVELVEEGVLEEPDGAGVGTEAAERGAGFDVEDLDEAGDVGGGNEAAIGAEGGGGDGVGEGGDGGGEGEGGGGEEGEGGGVGGGE